MVAAAAVAVGAAAVAVGAAAGGVVAAIEAVGEVAAAGGGVQAGDIRKFLIGEAAHGRRHGGDVATTFHGGLGAGDAQGHWRQWELAGSWPLTGGMSDASTDSGGLRVGRALPLCRSRIMTQATTPLVCGTLPASRVHVAADQACTLPSSLRARCLLVLYFAPQPSWCRPSDAASAAPDDSSWTGGEAADVRHWPSAHAHREANVARVFA